MHASGSSGLPRDTPLANFHLAGDYTASDYPATLEAAVRSGIARARGRSLGDDRAAL